MKQWFINQTKTAKVFILMTVFLLGVVLVGGFFFYRDNVSSPEKETPTADISNLGEDSSSTASVSKPETVAIKEKYSTGLEAEESSEPPAPWTERKDPPRIVGLDKFNILGRVVFVPIIQENEETRPGVYLGDLPPPSEVRIAPKVSVSENLEWEHLRVVTKDQYGRTVPVPGAPRVVRRNPDGSPQTDASGRKVLQEYLWVLASAP